MRTTIAFTPAERDFLLHRMDTDCIEQVFADTDGMELLALGCQARCNQLADQLRKTDTVFINPANEQDEAILTDCVDGSTWFAVQEGHGDASRQKLVAIERAMTSAAKKIEQAFGLPSNSINIVTA